MVSGWTKNTIKKLFFWKAKKIIQNLKTQKCLEICKNSRYTLWPEVSNPSGSVVSTMFCNAKSAKNFLKMCGDFRPLPNKNVQIWDQFFPLIFPERFRISKNIWHPTLGSGGKKMYKCYLKSEQTDRQTHRQMDISTYRKHWPRGPMLWKSCIRETLSPLKCVWFGRTHSIPCVLSIPWVHVYTVSPCQYHESMSIPWVLAVIRENSPLRGLSSSSCATGCEGLWPLAESFLAFGQSLFWPSANT